MLLLCQLIEKVSPMSVFFSYLILYIRFLFHAVLCFKLKEQKLETMQFRDREKSLLNITARVHKSDN